MASTKGIFNNKANKFGKIGIAKANTVKVEVEGDYENDRQKFNSLVTSLGVTFTDNYVNNNDTVNALNNTINDLNNVINNLNSTISDLNIAEQKIDEIANLLGITFDANGILTAEEYTTHTHGYEDSTITDTADGTGALTTTNKTTEGIN